MNSFCRLAEDALGTKFVLKGINPSQLDKEYLLQDLQDIGLEQLSTSLMAASSNSKDDPTTKVTSSLELIGLAKSKIKAHETIVVNEVQLRLFVTPAPTSTLEDLVDINKLRTCLCWYCRHHIPAEWHPVGIPVRFERDQDLFEVEGIFCSFNCIVAYLSEHSEYRYKDSTVLLSMMYRRIFNIVKHITDINPSPSWKLLKEYGGHLSIDDYRKHMQFIEFKSLQQTIRREFLKISQASEVFIEC